MPETAKIRKVTEEVTIEDTRLLFRNFQGEKRKFNPAGARNFSAVLDQDTAKRMAADGWNIKWLKAREEGDEDMPHIKINVAFGSRPPRIILVTGKKRTALNEETVMLVDSAEIEKVDLSIRPYNWVDDETGETKVTAYLKTMYVTIVQNDLDRKYEVDDAQ